MIGRAARARVKAGGPIAKGRFALSLDENRAVKREAWGRTQGWCGVVLDGVPCNQRAVDGDHVKERSRGGSDAADNRLAVCRPHHERKTFPYAKGRLVISALGGGRFESQILWRDPRPFR